MSRAPAILLALCTRAAVLGLAGASALTTVSTRSWAQAPALQTDLSNSVAEVGEPFSLTLTVQGSGDAQPSAPTLKLPPGFSQRGPSISTRSQVSIRGGRITQQQGIGATWTLVASNAGTFTLGPASVTVGGRRYSGEQVRIRIVAAGSGTPRGGRPFDPFGMLRGFPGLSDNQGDPLEDFFPSPPDEFRVDVAPDPVAFIRAEVVPARAVVGEPIIYRAFAYGSRGPFNEVKSSEAPRADFLAYPIVENSFGGDIHRVRIGERVFHAVKIRETILVPIRSGLLEVGAMTMGFGGPAYPSRVPGRGLPRDSNPVRVTVTEPPFDGRPPGYTLGDVGSFRLTARVEPRVVSQGDSVSVIVRLDGQGNLPSSLKPPQQTGVEWLEPNVQEQVDPSGGSLGGWRRFSYTARLTQAGEVELGSFRLPFWNPGSKRYESAEAALGSVRVDPDPSAKLDNGDAERPKVEVSPRTELASVKKPAAPPTDLWYFWASLFGAPLGVLLLHFGGRAGGRVRKRLKQRSAHGRTLAEDALARAKQEFKAGNHSQAASDFERALVHATLGATGVKARGVLRTDLPKALEAGGVSPELAATICELLETFDAVRFTGEPLEPSVAQQVRDVLTRLDKLGRKPSGEASAELGVQ